MVRNSEQIIGVARSFFLLPGAEKVVILRINTERSLGSSKQTGIITEKESLIVYS